MLDGVFMFIEFENMKKNPMGLFLVLLSPKKDKIVQRRALPAERGRETSFPLVVQPGQKRLNLY